MKSQKWLRTVVFAALLGFVSTVGTSRVWGQFVTELDDLVYWVGSGANQAGLVIAWNDVSDLGNPVNVATFAWGYRWDGSATAEEALQAVVEADPRLFMRWSTTAFSFGTVLFGLGYDANDDGIFGVTGAVDELGNPITLSFMNGIADTTVPFNSAGVGPAQVGDLYWEDFWDGFWNLQTGSGPGFPVMWSDSQDGLSGLALVDQGWIGLQSAGFDSEFNPIAPPIANAVAAIPEPHTGLLLLLAGLGWLTRRQR